MDTDPTPKPIYKSLYFQVITAIVIIIGCAHRVLSNPTTGLLVYIGVVA